MIIDYHFDFSDFETFLRRAEKSPNFKLNYDTDDLKKIWSRRMDELSIIDEYEGHMNADQFHELISDYFVLSPKAAISLINKTFDINLSE
jgi:hypothetical protein